MNKHLLLLFVAIFMISEVSDAQSPGRAERASVHVGMEFSTLFQSQMFLEFEDTVMDSNGVYSFTSGPRNSFRFGGYFRFDLFGRHSLETGLYHVTRRYNSVVSLASTGEELGRNTIRGVSFEIPLTWAVSVQLDRDSRLSTGFGGVITYFASDFGIFDLEYNLDAFKRSRFLPGIKAHVGFEHDFGREGGIYFGANFQHNFQSIAFLRMEYFTDGTSEAIGQVELNGSYFAAVLRYMFPMR